MLSRSRTPQREAEPPTAASEGSVLMPNPGRMCLLLARSKPPLGEIVQRPFIGPTSAGARSRTQAGLVSDEQTVAALVDRGLALHLVPPVVAVLELHPAAHRRL